MAAEKAAEREAARAGRAADLAPEIREFGAAVEEIDRQQERVAEALVARRKALAAHDGPAYDRALRDGNDEQALLNTWIEAADKERERLVGQGVRDLPVIRWSPAPPTRNTFPTKWRDSSASGRRGRFAGGKSSAADHSQSIEDLPQSQQEFVREWPGRIQKIQRLIREENEAKEELPHARDRDEAVRAHDDLVERTDDAIRAATQQRRAWLAKGIEAHLLAPVPRNPDREEEGNR